MIGRLRGAVAEVGEEEALIDVGGVGYGALRLAHPGAPAGAGDETLLHVETQWTEAAGMRLYGFATREDRRAFVLLQNIQGVGPKAALSVLDVLPPADLAQAVAREDKALVGRAQGVGPKLAQRIVTELKGKPISDGPVAALSGSAPRAPVAPSIAGEAVAALMGLGVAEVIGRRAVEQAVVRLGEDADLAAVIKAALQEIGK